MSKTAYKVTSEEGAEKYGVEIGETVHVDLEKDVELAVVAAGWIEHVTKPAKDKE